MSHAGGRDWGVVATVWAKSEPQGRLPLTHWLPLHQHLDDTGAVAGFLWDEWLAPSARAAISRGLPDGEADGRRLVTWLAGIHDVGKATPAFAIQAPTLVDRMVRDGGFEPPGPMVRLDRAKLRHEWAGAAALADWLEDRGFSEGQAEAFAVVVGGHHGDFPSFDHVLPDDRLHVRGEGRWAEARALLLDRAAERFGVADRLVAWRTASFPRAAQMVVTGLVIMADWIASSADYFELLPVDVVPAVPGPHDSDDARLAKGLRRLALTPRWRPVVGDQEIAARFADRFPRVEGAPRPVQEAVARAAETMPVPGILIVEAPMGEGKTEAAFLAAEILAARSGASGCFVALPTQATSNAMFARMLDWLKRLPTEDGDSASVALVHGKAALNDEYREIRFPPRWVESDPEAAPGGAPETQRLDAVVDEWMTGRKRAALSSFVVGTIDQVLFSALVARHVAMRALSLVGKVVILDEVHAADVYMSEFLDRALEWLGACGTPVVLLSATLPPARRAALYAAYENGRRGTSNARQNRAVGAEVAAGAQTVNRLLGYPSVVTSGDDGPSVVELEPSGRRTEVDVRRLDDDLDTLTETLTEQLRDGGCAVVIRNTVRRVQEAARHLTDVFGPDVVSVAHAQFLASDRIENDDRLLGMFGPPGSAKRPQKHIVVASQVVEQSLDVDFDLMVTDIAPVDLVLQRMGRLHRHRRGEGERDRPEPLRRAQCWVTDVDWAATPPKPGPSKVIYGTYLLLASAAVLAPHLDGRSLRLPEDIAPLVAEAYGGPDAPSGWETAWEVARRKDHDAAERRRGDAQGYLFGKPFTGTASLLDSMTAGLGRVDEDSPRGQRCVRDGGESIEVVVVQRTADGDQVPAWVPFRGGEPLPIREYPVDPGVARALARCTLRMPFSLTHEGIYDATIRDLERNYFPGWNDSPHLRGMLALVLDEDLSARFEEARCTVTYDRRYGLMVTKDD